MLSIIIPSYNRRACVLDLLEDLKQQRDVEFEIIVVDDCSPDGSAEAVAAAFPEVKLLVNEKNGGPCVARNRGIRAARGEFVVGFDSDVRVPDPTFLARAHRIFTGLPTEVHGLAFRLLQPDGHSEDRARWWHPVPIAEFADRTFETSYFSGTGYAFRREAALAAGLFPEVLYMHYEEVELAWRILDNGGIILHCPQLAVIHHAAPTTRRGRIETFYKPRNQILLAMGTLPFPNNLGYIAPRCAYQGFKSLTHGHFGSYLSALRSACHLLLKVMGGRKKLRKSTLRKVAQLKNGKARDNSFGQLKDSPETAPYL